MPGERGRDTRTGEWAPSAEAKAPFGGKKAAPFKHNGGRKPESKRTHEGKIRKKKGPG